MTISKKLLAVAAAAALTAATAVPALALENEFHGMYRFFGMQSNFNNGLAAGGGLRNNANSGFVADQRARLQYIAKANDDLKLVTHFELDTRFGGINDANNKGIPGGNDSGNFDADAITLETKHVFLDFNIPNTGVNAKIGIQPWADSYQTIFVLADLAGVNLTKKFGPLSTQLAWFRLDDNTTNGIAANTQLPPNATATPATNDPGKLTADLIVLDGKYAVSKNLTVGASYYNVQRDTTASGNAGTAGLLTGINQVELLHMIGLNASVKAGPATINPFFAYQFGDGNRVGTRETDLGGFLAGVTTKTKVGPGNINFSAIYLSGDDNATDDKNDDFKIIVPSASYFNAANMWFLFRNAVGQNSNATITGNDVTLGGRGAMGVFGGYEGTVGKIFYDANIGYLATAEKRGSEDSAIGTEINAKVGYKMYDNLTTSLNAAYCILGDALSSSTAANRIGGAADADDPYLFNVMVQYVF